ncbi:hypothetical protein BpHYR1_018270 [Brachionus plicatilis]|uniref:Uncharacterized protein n=1 Tax=Brachionus plicatilis TaxID=10195 RepID=A0A3M7QNV9_BRAPC|nr:hypothetical protein BpHYR1_018270 [Brachionus plicatilis]
MTMAEFFKLNINLFVLYGDKVIPEKHLFLSASKFFITATTPLENSFQEYYDLSNVINSENLSNPLQLDEPNDLNIDQNYQADAQKSSNGPERRGRLRGIEKIKQPHKRVDILTNLDAKPRLYSSTNLAIGGKRRSVVDSNFNIFANS